MNNSILIPVSNKYPTNKRCGLPCVPIKPLIAHKGYTIRLPDYTTCILAYLFFFPSDTTC